MASNAMAGLVVLLSVLVGYYYIENSKLTAELVITNVGKSQIEANYNGLSKELDKLKKDIEANEVDYEAGIKRYEEAIKNAKSKIKYVEVKSNECEDIKRIFDDIRSNGY